MNSVIKCLLLIAGSFLVAPQGQAQDIEKDLERMIAAYKDGEKLYLEMENTVYKGDKKVNQVSSSLLKSGKNYQYKTEEQQLLVNDHYVIFVDKRNYNLIISDRNPKQEALQQKTMPMNKDVLKQYKEVLYKGEKGGYKHYQLKNPKEKVVTIDLFFETKTGFIKRAIYHHNPALVPDNMSTEIQLKVINTAPTVSSSMFSEKNYIAIKDKKLTPTSSYKKYSLHDNRSKQQ